MTGLGISCLGQNDFWQAIVVCVFGGYIKFWPSAVEIDMNDCLPRFQILAVSCRNRKKQLPGKIPNFGSWLSNTTTKIAFQDYKFCGRAPPISKGRLPAKTSMTAPQIQKMNYKDLYCFLHGFTYNPACHPNSTSC